MARLAGPGAAFLAIVVVAVVVAGLVGAPPSEGRSVGAAGGPLPSRALPVAAHADSRPRPESSSALLDPHWANLTVAGSAVPPSGPATVVYDAKDGYVLWYGLTAAGVPGGATWSYSSGTWTNRTSSAGPGPAGATWGTAAYDAGDGYVVWYGGTASPSADATWSFAGGKWANLTSTLLAQPTPSRVLASGAYDPVLGGVVVFGGYDGTAYLGDTWKFSHGGWTSISGSPAPPARVSAGLAFDAGDDYLLLAGGGTSAGPTSDTWALNGTNWTELVAADGPTGFGGAQGLTVAPGGAVIGFGGVGCAGPLQGPCNVTEEFSAGAWQPIPELGAPSPRAGMELVYDADDGSVIAWGGATGGAYRDDTWALGGPLRLAARAAPNLVGPDDAAFFDAYAGGGYGPFSFTWSGVPPDCPLVNASVMPCESEIPGNYTVVSHLTDTAGNVTTALAAFQVLHQLSAGIEISPATIDLGQSASLTVSVIGGGRVTNYSWVGLPVGCSSAYTVEVNCTPVNPGYYSIVVTVEDNLSHLTTTPDAALVVNPLPSVGIWSNVTFGYAPMAVQFFASVFGGSPTYSFRWSFGDGATSLVPDPAHTFAGSGVYSAGLTVTDARGGVAGSANLTIDVLNPLEIQAQASQSYPNVDQAVGFTAVVSGGGSPYAYAWTFGDGTTSSVADPSHAFGASGAHTVVLVVMDAHGTTAVGTVVVDVQGTVATSTGTGSVWTNPWVDGLIGAMVGIAVTTFAIRTPAALPAEPPAPRRPDRRAPAAGGAPEGGPPDEGGPPPPTPPTP